MPGDSDPLYEQNLLRRATEVKMKICSRQVLIFSLGLLFLYDVRFQSLVRIIHNIGSVTFFSYFYILASICIRRLSFTTFLVL